MLSLIQGVGKHRNHRGGSVDDMMARIRDRASADRDRHVAYHEMAHAIVAHVLGLEVVSISVDHGQMLMREDDRSHQLKNSSEDILGEDVDPMMKIVKVTLAGFLGERLGLGSSLPGSERLDLEVANALLRRMKDRKSQGMTLQNEVAGLLAAHEAILKLLAEQILEKRSMSGETFRQLFAPPPAG